MKQEAVSAIGLTMIASVAIVYSSVRTLDDNVSYRTQKVTGTIVEIVQEPFSSLIDLEGVVIGKEYSSTQQKKVDLEDTATGYFIQLTSYSYETKDRMVRIDEDISRSRNTTLVFSNTLFDLTIGDSIEFKALPYFALDEQLQTPKGNTYQDIVFLPSELKRL